MTLRNFHPGPMIGLLFLIASAIAHYQNDPQPLPGHHAGFFYASRSGPDSTRAGHAQHPCTVTSSNRQAGSSGIVRSSQRHLANVWADRPVMATAA